MKTATIEAEVRKNSGSHDARRLRRSGMVPCTLNRKGKAIHFVIPEKNLKTLIFTPDAYFLDIKMNGDKKHAVIKEIQFDKVTDKIIHVDLTEFEKGEEIVVELPVITKGRSLGEVKGGKVFVLGRKLKVKGVPETLPETIEVDISALEVGKAIQVKDLSLPGVKVLDPPSRPVVAVSFVKYEEVTPEKAAEAVPAEGVGAVPAEGAGAVAPSAEEGKKEEKPEEKKKKEKA